MFFLRGPTKEILVEYRAKVDFLMKILETRANTSKATNVKKSVDVVDVAGGTRRRSVRSSSPPSNFRSLQFQNSLYFFSLKNKYKSSDSLCRYHRSYPTHSRSSTWTSCNQRNYNKRNSPKNHGTTQRTNSCRTFWITVSLTIFFGNTKHNCTTRFFFIFW